MRELSGKRVLITGGARGIGLALGRAFAAEGAEVVLTDVDDAVLAEAARALGDGAARTYALDVTDAQAVAELRARLHDEAGPVDVLVNNAGVVFGGGFAEVELERHLLTFHVNLLGLVKMTYAFLPDLLSRPQAHLVNMASASGFIGLPYGSTYASSKWGVIGFSDSLRQELRLQGHHRIGVTTVCPGYVSTGLFHGARAPRTTRLLTPERLARLVVRAVQRNRPYVLAPWLIKVTPFIRGALPLWLSDRISALLGVTTSMRGWRGRQGP